MPFLKTPPRTLSKLCSSMVSSIEVVLCGSFCDPFSSLGSIQSENINDLLVVTVLKQ